MVQIIYGKLNLIVTSSPNMDSINDFISTIHKNKVTDIVRLCDLCYDEDILKSLCIIHDYSFDDGKFPPDDIIYKWINLLFIHFYEQNSIYSKQPILVHCNAGLGRAPLLVCIAIIICENKDPYDVIIFIRKLIKYSLNKFQVQMLTNTNWRKYRDKFNKLNNKKNGCIIC